MRIAALAALCAAAMAASAAPAGAQPTGFCPPTPQQQAICPWGSLRTMPDPVGFHLYDAAIDSTNTIYALANAGADQYSIVAMNTSGQVLRSWSAPGLAPAGIAVSATNPEFVAVGDPAHQSVVIYNNIGQVERTLGSAGTGKGQFSTVTDIAVDPSANIYVADAVNGRLSQFNEAGSYQADWTDDIPGRVTTTTGKEQYALVTSAGSDPYLFTINTSDIDGKLETGDQTRLPSDSVPTGLTTDSAYDSYVSDAAFGSVLGLTSSLDPIESWPNSLEFPAGSVVDSSNNLYVINAPGGPGAPPGQPGEGIVVFSLSNVSNASLGARFAPVFARTPSIPVKCATRGNVYCNGTLTLLSGGRRIARRGFSIRRGQQVSLHPKLSRSVAGGLKRAGRLGFTAEVRTRDRGRDRIERSGITLQFVHPVCGRCTPPRS
jgi:hypothetical protein